MLEGVRKRTPFDFQATSETYFFCKVPLKQGSREIWSGSIIFQLSNIPRL